MAKNYLLIDFGNTNIKCTVYSGIYDRIMDIIVCPNTTTALQLLKSFYSVRGFDINMIVECVTTSPNMYRQFNADLALLLPNAKLKILGMNDFAEELKDIGGHSVKKTEAASPDILLATFWFKKFQPSGCIVNFGAFYFAIAFKDREFKNLYLLPGISHALDLIANHTTAHQDQIPKTFKSGIGTSTTEAISVGGATLMEGLIDKVIKDNGIDPKDIILTGGDVEKYPDLISKYKVDKNFWFNVMVEFVKSKEEEWDK